MTNKLPRALRLPFILASILPFTFGSLIERAGFNAAGFIFGFIAVSCTHLSANLINDYADAKSGSDAIDTRFFGFFGGSKLIQEGAAPAGFYLALSALFGAISALSAISLALLLNDAMVLFYFSAVILLSWAYSMPPLQFSYRGLGEPLIFILFGPVPVMGGYYIQTGIFPDMRSFMLSLPFGFLTCAILFANEVPDFNEDKKAGKVTWVNITGQERAFILYSVLMALGFASVLLNIHLGFLDFKALAALFFLIPAFKAAGILRKDYRDKVKMLVSSKLTIGIQAFAGIFLTAGLFI